MLLDVHLHRGEFFFSLWVLSDTSKKATQERGQKQDLSFSRGFTFLTHKNSESLLCQRIISTWQFPAEQYVLLSFRNYRMGPQLPYFCPDTACSITVLFLCVAELLGDVLGWSPVLSIDHSEREKTTCVYLLLKWKKLWVRELGHRLSMETINSEREVLFGKSRL